MILDTDHCYYMLNRYYDTSHSYFVFMSHWYIYTCTTSLILVTQTTLLHMLTAQVYMHVWFLYSWYMDPRSYYMYYCSMFPYSWYMIVSCYWYGFTDTGHESCWYAICGIPHLLLYCSRYIVPIILFSLYCSRFPLYCSTLSTELRSSYHVTRIIYSSCSCYIVYMTYQIIKLTGVCGRLDGWLALIGWCTGSILFSHCRGR